MTMVVDTHLDSSGQSVMELLFMLPVIIAITVVMTRVNTAIQVSIVNQQYARAQAHWLAFNSAVYPELRLRTRDFMSANRGYNQLLLGISGDTPPADETIYNPSAMVYEITRNKQVDSGANTIQAEQVSTRGKVRIRTTVSLCTQANVIGQGKTAVPLLVLNGKAPYHPVTGEQGTWKIRDSTPFDWCTRPLDYL